MCLDIKNFYLTAALDYYKYMKIPLTLFPEWIKKQYNLTTHARDGFVFLEIRRAVWGLPQAGILANTLLQKQLKPYGYYECVNTPGLWRHANRPITFSLIVDDFGVNYVGKEHAEQSTRRIAPVAAIVNEFVETTQNTNKTQLLASNYGTFRALVNSENFIPQNGPSTQVIDATSFF
jgi:hypothetical protein